MPSTDGVISAMQGVLHIAENGVEPLEHVAVVIRACIVGDDRCMIAVRLSDSGKTIQATGNDKTSRPDLLCAPSSDFLLGEPVDMAQLEKKRMLLG